MSRAPSPTSSSHERSCKCHGITARARRFARPELDIQHARTAQASASAVEFLSSFLMTWNPPDDAHPAVLALVVPVTAKHRDSRVQPRISCTSTHHPHLKWRQSPRPSRPDEPSRFNPDGRRFDPGSCAAPVQSRRRFKSGTHTGVTSYAPSVTPGQAYIWAPVQPRFVCNPGSIPASTPRTITTFRPFDPDKSSTDAHASPTPHLTATTVQ